MVQHIKVYCYNTLQPLVVVQYLLIKLPVPTLRSFTAWYTVLHSITVTIRLKSIFYGQPPFLGRLFYYIILWYSCYLMQHTKYFGWLSTSGKYIFIFRSTHPTLIPTFLFLIPIYYGFRMFFNQCFSLLFFTAKFTQTVFPFVSNTFEFAHLQSFFSIPPSQLVLYIFVHITMVFMTFHEG